MKTIFSVSLFFLCIFYVLTGAAVAHGVNVFAYVAGDTVYVEGRLSGGKHVKGGKIVVADGQGHTVASGLTDDNGRFSFKVSIPTDLTILLLAGQGHQAKWVVRASELADVQAKSTPASGTGKPGPPERAKSPDEAADDLRKHAPDTSLKPEAVEAILESVLNRKLEPVVNMLADCRQDGIHIKDVFGGIGYIFGLVGIAAYVKYRKKQS